MACCKCCEKCQSSITSPSTSRPTYKKDLSPEVAHLLHHFHILAKEEGARISDAYRHDSGYSEITVVTKLGTRWFEIQDPPINEAWVEENIARFYSLLVPETKTEKSDN